MPLISALPRPGATDKLNPVGVRPGNAHVARSMVCAVFRGVEILQALGAGAPTERFKTVAVPVPSKLLAVNV